MLPEQTAGMFCQGARVRVKGLTARPELNGERGRILAFHAERGRYAVAMHVSNERILLKPVNLEPAMDAACEAAVAFATDQCLASTEGRRKEIDEPDGLVAFDEACEQAMAALAAMDPSSAASAARRAIALRPSSCAGHLLLADSANYGGDLRAAATGYARTMELAEEGTYNWAKAATSIHEILMDPDCPAVFGASLPKPAWLDEPQRFKEVSAKVLETTATIDHPGAHGLAWRMHGDACSRLLEHREAARSFRKAAAGMDPQGAAETLVLAEEADARHARQRS